MAVPKRKTTTARRNTRRSACYRLEVPAMAKCEQCGAIKRPHRICESCGYYNGVQRIKVKESA
ncbi:MAG: 50S ribosomal protein L32 [Fibromonadaceae bacterium]|jgi:large subunit ribosomal protein L32|nr:50S ribosomal protein L32 [Fibromonadaceae bacterium]